MYFYLIAGVINSMPNKVYFWKAYKYSDNLQIGDYAIVENLNGYDLVKIAGIVYTNDDNAKTITGVDSTNLKKIVKYIPKEEL